MTWMACSGCMASTRTENKPRTENATKTQQKSTSVRTGIKAGGRGGLIYPGEL